MSLQMIPAFAESALAGPTPTSRELESAGQVQRRLMKTGCSSMATLEYEGRCLPAGSVGGDYFDFLTPSPGRLGLAVGDVSGKGLSAALMMASLHASLRTLYAAGPADMGEALLAVNDVFGRATSSHHYASLFLGEYDDAEGVLRYINCGHVAPLLVRANGSIIRLESTSTVLGIFEDWSPSSCHVTLSPGDTLIAFSDGISEAAGDGPEEFGDRRLAQAALAHRHLPVPALVDALLAACCRFSGFKQVDDMTLVVARVNGSTKEFA